MSSVQVSPIHSVTRIYKKKSAITCISLSVIPKQYKNIVMYSYPPEYLLHPVPVLALYGLKNTDEPSLLVDVEPTENIGSPSRKDSTSRSGLANSLLSILTNKTEYTLYEATRYLSNSQAPPFRVITVSKVILSFQHKTRFLIYLRIMYYLKNN